MSTPKLNPIKANIPPRSADGPAKALQLVVFDISAGGVGLTLPPDDVGLRVGAQFVGISIDLPDVGRITADLRVRNLYDVTMPNGKVQQRAGCEFVKLPGSMTKLIQRYIMQIERERKARGA